MMATLYKTDVPKDFANGEFYQPALTVEKLNGQYVYIVREKHGWFSAEQKRLVNLVQTFSPEEGFRTIEEAQAVFDRQVRHRASEGFRHQFEFDPVNGLRYTDLGPALVASALIP